MQIIQSLQTSNLGVTSVTQVFDQYDCEISIKQLERDRRTGRETTPTYVISGRRMVPNSRTFMKNATKKSALAEFICAYLTDTAPQFLKGHQWLMLAGGFTNGQLAKVVEHTGVRERPAPTRRPTQESCCIQSISLQHTRGSLSDATILMYQSF